MKKISFYEKGDTVKARLTSKNSDVDEDTEVKVTVLSSMEPSYYCEVFVNGERWVGWLEMGDIRGVVPKYQLPGRDGGFFFRDDEQLRKSVGWWLRWLPCSIIWKIQVWWYYHA